MRGLIVRKAFDWFNEQKIDRTKYDADFCAHSDTCEWSTIFVINKHGISGEIIRDRPHTLTQGFYDENKPLVFYYDFKTWRMSPNDNEAISEMERLVKYLYVPDSEKQKLLAEKVGATFYKDYLLGYFETGESKIYGLHFEDYSQVMGELYKDFVVNIDEKFATEGEIRGRGATSGVARGKVKIVKSAEDDFPDGAVLVAAVTTPDLVGLMKKSSAIVTDKGGILSHAAIVARELGKPCVVDAGDATTKLCDGQLVEVDGRGMIKIL
jgi:phosphohistidine swiveling domain-containing protein